jgi:hypothetical protein
VLTVGLYCPDSSKMPRTSPPCPKFGYQFGLRALMQRRCSSSLIVPIDAVDVAGTELGVFDGTGQPGSTAAAGTT